MTDFTTFILDNSDKVFRYWVKKTIFTPHEQAEKYIDQSIYENETCSYAYIRKAIELPDGDILLELEDWEGEGSYSYYKLSEISLARLGSDNNVE